MTAVDFSQFVDELAAASGAAILPFFRSQLVAQDKSAGQAAFDPVTEADKAAESVMRHMIKRTFPAHGIVGEEYGSENAQAEYVWVLDPIDGTKSFICGLPMWGTLIGLMRGGRAVHGLMHQPFTGERFAGDGRVTRYRGPGSERTLRVRSCAGLSDAVIATTSPRLMHGDELARFHAVEERTRLSRYGGDCYSYCMLAAGHIDLVIETGLKPYDVVALIPIIEGAGGIITNWSGGSAESGGAIIAAGDRRVHEAALAVLAG
jgi:histidinol phosphatase-like enzyme (inositol monophosphatase family)